MRRIFLAFLALLFSANAFAQVKISALPPLLNADAVGADMFPIVDTTTDTTKSMSLTQLDLRYYLSTQAILLGSQVSGVLPVVNGGTNATTAAGARTSLGAAASGANSDITSLSGLTTPLSIAQGGTNSTTKAAAFNALSPMSTTGDLTYESSANTASRLAVGSTGNVLTVSGGIPAWAPPATSGTVTSVAATVPSFMSISGSPVTSSGTLAFGLSGTALPITSGGTGATAATGTGNVVLATSPTLVTPALGTPASATLTNATGLPLTTGVTGTLPIGNGGTGATSATGTGNVVLANSPSLVTPVLGTPASGTLTNATGLPLTTGITGTLGTSHGGTGVTSVTVAPTASSFAGWDANSNFSANSLIPGYQTTDTSAFPLTLTVSSPQTEYITGSTAAQTLTLPVTSTLVNGFNFKIVNNASVSVAVNSSGGNLVQTMAANSYATLTVIGTTHTTAIDWNVSYSVNNAGGGTVTSVAATVPTGLAVSGSPITTNGTLALTWSGTIPAAQVPVATTGANGGITLKAPTLQSFTAGSGTYTTPAGVLWIHVRMVGPGGGGGGGGTSPASGSSGSAATTFGTSLLSAGAGAGGTHGSSGASGGSSSLGGATGFAFSGGGGGPGGTNDSINTTFPLGGMGGGNAFSGTGGLGAIGSTNGGSAPANSGGGGGGGGAGALSSSASDAGCGGGAGGYVDAIIGSPSASYSYVVGSGGGGGSGNSSTGGNGGSGMIVVEEHYY